MNRNKLSVAVAILLAGMVSQNALYAAGDVDSISSPAGAEKQTPDTHNLQEKVQGNSAAWKNMKNFVSQSDVALWGVVSDIQYKLSDQVDAGQSPIPYTFVTYDVKKVIHGNGVGKQVVLRFIGGLDEKTMRYMGASNVPNFDVGDEDVLFVQGNTKSMSPLVLNDRGRFRVVGGDVFSDNGQEVNLDDKGQIQYGKRHRLDEILTTTVNGSQGTMVMKHKVSPNAVKQASSSISADELVKKIRAMRIPAKPTAKFVNADIYSSLKAPGMKAALAPSANEPKNTGKKTAQDEITTAIGEMPSSRQTRK